MRVSPSESGSERKVIEIRKTGRLQAAGIFTWVLETNTVYCDAAVAAAFGLGNGEYENGLPINRFLERMHADDVGRIARAIHDAIVTGEPYQENYRICRPDGTIITVSAFGSCFRNSDGDPAHYAGIVFPMTPNYPNDDVLLHFLAALEAAKKSGNPKVVQKTIEILEIIRGVVDSTRERPGKWASR